MLREHIGFPMNKNNILFISIMLAFILVPLLASSLLMSRTNESVMSLFNSNYDERANNFMLLAAEYELSQDISKAAKSYMAAGNYFEKAQKLDSDAFAFRASGLLSQSQADVHKSQVAFIRAIEIYEKMNDNSKVLEIKKLMTGLPNFISEAERQHLKSDAESNQEHTPGQVNLSSLDSYPLGL